MPRQVQLAFAGLALAWAASFVAVPLMVEGFGWVLTAAAVSLVVAGVSAFAARRGTVVTRRVSRRSRVALGVLVAVQNAGMCLAFHNLGLAPTAVVLAAVPLFATVIGQVRGEERITAPAASGLVCGLVGLVAVLLFSGQDDGWAFISGMLAGLVSAFAAALANRYAEARMSARPDAVAASHLIAAVLVLPALVLGGAAGTGSPTSWPALVVLAAAVALAGPTLYARLPELGQSAAAARIKTAGLAFAALVGVIVFGDRLTLGQALGALLVGVGAALVLDLWPFGTPARETS